MQDQCIRPFNPHEDNVQQKWLRWVDRFQLFLEVKKITDAKEQISNFLYYGGDYVYDSYQPLKDAGADTTLKSVVDKVTTVFVPVVSKNISIFRFRACKQFDGEPFSEYMDRLRDLVKLCNFSSVEEELKAQIIQGCSSDELRRRAMEDESLDLAKIINLGKTIESVDSHMKEMSGVSQAIFREEAVNQLNSKSEKASGREKKCFCCGGAYPHDSECPAKDKVCNKCKKIGHYGKCCKGNKNVSKVHDKVNMIRQFVNKYESESDEDTQYVYAIGDSTKIPRIVLEIGKSKVQFAVDTAATINLMDSATYNGLHLQPKLKKSQVKAFTYGSNKPINIIGQFETRSRYNGEFRHLIINVVEGNSGNILGFKSVMELNILNFVNSVTSSPQSEDAFVTELAKKYPSLFSNKIGKLKDHFVKLHIDNEIKPVRQKRRSTPIHLRAGIEKALKQMLENDIIEPVNGPTPWVSPIVPVVKRDGEIRVCTDAKILNTAIRREVHHTSTIEEVAIRLNGAKIISKLDLRSAYNQLELHPESRDITVFSTHMGLFRYKRLNFGIASAAEEFQKTIEGVVGNISQCENLSDDIVVYGVDNEDHDKVLHKVLQCLETNGLTLNTDKSKFRQTSLDFFGLNFSKDGIKLSQSKIDALLKAEDPQDVKELKSLNGLISYASKYIKDAATLLAPFQDLLKKNAKFIWTEKHSEGLKTIKQRLTTEAMGYFDPLWCTELTTDASPTGLGAVLAQHDPNDPLNRKIILYASRSLTAVERKYSQVEREALAVVWACERLRFYLIGKEFELFVDNKAVELIFGNPKAKVCARIERWSLRLIPFKMKIKHIPGITNIADYISRHATEEVKRGVDSVEEYVNMLIDYHLPLHIKLETIIRATLEDDELNKVKQMLSQFEPEKHSNLKEYAKIRNELSVSSDGLLLYGSRIIIPQTIQNDVISVAHLGHQGREKTLALLSEFMWFPNMSRRVGEFIHKCHACKCNSEVKQFQPLMMSKMPEGAWEELATDFHGPLPSGEYLMVTIDEFFRFPIVKIVKSTNADTVIRNWTNMFQLFGYPKQVKSDNGPPFQSYKISEFLSNHNIKHRKITPLWPRANAICERFMRNLNRVMRNCKASGKDWRVELDVFLSNYRATPHDSTGVAPAKLLLKTRSSSCNFPVYTNSVCKTFDFENYARENDAKAKNVMKRNMDKRLKARNHKFQIGDRVLIRLTEGNKSTPKYDPHPYNITSIKGSMLTAKRGNETKTRNCSFFISTNGDWESKDIRLRPIPVITAENVPAAAPITLIPPPIMPSVSSPSSLISSCTLSSEPSIWMDFLGSDHELSLHEEEDEDELHGDEVPEEEIDRELIDGSESDEFVEDAEGDDGCAVDARIDPDESTSVLEVEKGAMREIGKRVSRKPKRYSDYDENKRAEELKSLIKS